MILHRFIFQVLLCRHAARSRQGKTRRKTLLLCAFIIIIILLSAFIITNNKPKQMDNTYNKCRVWQQKQNNNTTNMSSTVE